MILGLLRFLMTTKATNEATTATITTSTTVYKVRFSGGSVTKTAFVSDAGSPSSSFTVSVTL